MTREQSRLHIISRYKFCRLNVPCLQLQIPVIEGVLENWQMMKFQWLTFTGIYDNFSGIISLSVVAAGNAKFASKDPIQYIPRSRHSQIEVHWDCSLRYIQANRVIASILDGKGNALFQLYLAFAIITQFQNGVQTYIHLKQNVFIHVYDR